MTIASLDDVHGAPDVEVNGKDVSMAQGSDGSWYAYVADKTYADVADTNNGGLEFGYLCENTEGASVLDGTTTVSFADTQGFYSEIVCAAETSGAIETVDDTDSETFTILLGNGVVDVVDTTVTGQFQTGLILATFSDLDNETVVFTDADSDGKIDCTAAACELADLDAAHDVNAGTTITFSQANETFTVLTSEKSLNGNDNGNLAAYFFRLISFIVI
jgi:hypothetical protein